mgnify:CR=1 FL=1
MPVSTPSTFTLAVRETAAEGVFAGYPLSDFKATLYDGSFHTVDSNELSFKIAASMALKQGVMECKPVLQEPIMAVEVRVPEHLDDAQRHLLERLALDLDREVGELSHALDRLGQVVEVLDRLGYDVAHARPQRPDHRGFVADAGENHRESWFRGWVWPA